MKLFEMCKFKKCLLYNDVCLIALSIFEISPKINQRKFKEKRVSYTQLYYLPEVPLRKHVFFDEKVLLNNLLHERLNGAIAFLAKRQRLHWFCSIK